MNRSNDYKIISELLKEYYDKDIPDSELYKRLENVDKLSLFLVAHFLDIDKKRYQKEFDKIQDKKILNLYLNQK